jgi:hypothetical protein
MGGTPLLARIYIRPNGLAPGGIAHKNLTDRYQCAYDRRLSRHLRPVPLSDSTDIFPLDRPWERGW